VEAGGQRFETSGHPGQMIEMIIRLITRRLIASYFLDTGDLRK
jgi:hypothetical protein